MEWLILISLMRMDWDGYSLILNPFAGRYGSTLCVIKGLFGRTPAPSKTAPAPAP